MIEPGKEDIGKDVVLNFAPVTQNFKKNNKGIITHYNKEFVFVKFKDENQPVAVKRNLLQWTREGQHVNAKSYMF